MSQLVLVASLQDVTGALERLLGLLRRRVLPLESLSLYQAENNILEVVLRFGDLDTPEDRVAAEVSSLYDVLSVRRPDQASCDAARELAVVKTHGDLELALPETVSDVLQRHSPDSMELSGTPHAIDRALAYLQEQGLITGVSRSGEMFPPGPHEIDT
jgi:acetolactate synthase small subunit